MSIDVWMSYPVAVIKFRVYTEDKRKNEPFEWEWNVRRRDFCGKGDDVSLGHSPSAMRIFLTNGLSVWRLNFEYMPKLGNVETIYFQEGKTLVHQHDQNSHKK